MNENYQPETIETTDSAEVTTDVSLDAFDDGWGDDGYSDAAEVAEAETVEAGDEAAEADQQEADTGADNQAGDTAEPDIPSVQSEDAKTEAADQRFTLKHLDDVREVSREEVIELAQKGMDYDRKTQKLNDKIADYEEFLQELAGNIPIPQFMELTLAQMYKASAAKSGKEIGEAEALLKVQMDRQEKKRSKEADEAEKSRQADAAASNKAKEHLQRFREAYPDVKAEDIPQSVWDEVKTNGGDLLGAYTRNENAQLRKRIAALEQNQENRQRSTGSMKSSGKAKARDAFDEGWDNG